jgi:alpha,alpha-trehalose phosphorylase
MRDQGPVPFFDPRLPAEWDSLAFHLKVRGRLLLVQLASGSITLTVQEGDPLEVNVRGQRVLAAEQGVQVPLEPVAVPEPTVFPSGLPTASIPVVRGNS